MTIYVTPFKASTKETTGPSTDSGFENLEAVAAVMGEAGVSIDRMRQYGHDAEQAPVLIVTHKTTRAAIDQILEDFTKTQVVEGQPVALRIEAV